MVRTKHTSNRTALWKSTQIKTMPKGFFTKKKQKDPNKGRTDRNYPDPGDGYHGDGYPPAASFLPSPPPPPLKPPPLLDKDWRTLDWSKHQHMKDNLRRIQTCTPDVKHLRILVHGPVGAGKSSFINSIDSIFQGRLTSGAIVDAATGHSFTKTFQTHYIKDEIHHGFLTFAFCDIMGLELGQSEGVQTEDLSKVLKGHIKDGYTFNPVSLCSESDPHYNRSPRLGDGIHCLVGVISANKISMMEEGVINKMKEVRAKASSLKIPQVVVLTKVDEMCPKVDEDIRLVYWSRKIREKMQECSNSLGVPMNCIFPVKNYHEETDPSAEVDVLLLSALKTIVNFANDHVAKMAPPAANRRSSSSQY